MNRRNWAPILSKIKSAGTLVDIYTLDSRFGDAQILRVQHGILTVRYEFYDEDKLSGAKRAYIPVADISAIEETLSYVPTDMKSLEEIPTAEKDLE